MTNVIDLKAFKAGKKIAKDIDTILDIKDTETIGLSFEEIIKKNKDNEERLKKERSSDNKNVLKSYRIK
jgi:hypothetical protein